MGARNPQQMVRDRARNIDILMKGSRRTSLSNVFRGSRHHTLCIAGITSRTNPALDIW